MMFVSFICDLVEVTCVTTGPCLSFDLQVMFCIFFWCVF